MVLQEQSALPVKNLLPGPRGGSAFRARSRTTPKKIFDVSISPNIIRRTDRARGLAGQFRPESQLLNLLNHKEKLRCESLF
jgi:hypothetical protein